MPHDSKSLDNPEVLRDLVEQIGVGVYITRPDGAFVDANPAFLEILGVASVEQLRTLNANDFLDPDVRQESIRKLERFGALRDQELFIRRADGQYRTLLDSSYLVVDPVTGEKTLRGVVRDITVRKRLEGKLHEQAVRDPLTGVYNRRHLAEFEQKQGALPWGCILVDIDHFKQYNDTYGHHAGDQVLVRISRFLMRHVRAEASVVRMGGDEFLVLLPDSTAEQAASAAMRIQDAAAREATVAFSMGYAAREFQESLEETIRRADKGLYEVRTATRGPDAERRKMQ